MRTPFAVTGLSGLSGVSALAPGGVPPLPPVTALARQPGLPRLGGLSGTGWQADYYLAADLSGSIAFSRREVRVCGTRPAGHQPGGSADPAYAAVPADGWAVRYAGTVAAPVAGRLTFPVTASGRFRVKGRPHGSGGYTTLVDRFSDAADTATRTVVADPGADLAAGDRYDVVVEWAPNGGAKTLEIGLDHPGLLAPEVIEPVWPSGLHADKTEFYANLVDQGRNTFDGATGVDADGWPTSDCDFTFQESLNLGLDVDPLARGTVALRFLGKADLSLFGNCRTLTYGYAGGVTTGTFEVYQGGGYGSSGVRFRNTSRDGSGTGTAGFTGLTLMGPTGIDATTTYDRAVRFAPAILAGQARTATVLRQQTLYDYARTSADRTLPTYMNQRLGRILPPPGDIDFGYTPATTEAPAGSHENACRLANESGRDLHVSLPVLATDAAILDIVRIYAFGSAADGTPYTATTSSPYNPPLNPGQRVRFEIANETWNSFGPFNAVFRMCIVQAAAMRAIGGNPLGISASEVVSAHQWLAVRLAQIATLVRDNTPAGTLHGRIGTYLGWQYSNTAGTASDGLNLLHRIKSAGGLPAYGVAAGQVRDDITAMGGGGYWGSTNPEGFTTLAPDSGFQSPVVSAGDGFAVRPTAAGTTFSGPAGFVHYSNFPSGLDRPGSGTADDPYRPQVAWLKAGGAVTKTFAVTAAGKYGLLFQGMNRQDAGGTQLKVRLVLNRGTGTEQDVSEPTRDQPDGFVPYGPNAGASWPDWLARLVPSGAATGYRSKLLDLAAGTYTVSLVADGTAGTDTVAAGDAVAFTALLAVCSADAICVGFGGAGQATGQTADGLTPTQGYRVQAFWAGVFGVPLWFYESGLSLGGDFGKGPLPNWVQFHDSRTATAQIAHQTTFVTAGGTGEVFGTYAQVPPWNESIKEQGFDPATFDARPLIAGIQTTAATLPPLPDYDYTAPCVVPLTADAGTRTACDPDPGGWAGRLVVVGVKTVFTVTLTGAPAGSTVRVAGTAVASGGTITLPRGQHSLFVQMASGQSVPASGMSVTLAPAGTVSGPTLTTFAPSFPAGGDTTGSIALGWAAVSGATGYVVRWGLDDGDGHYPYPNRVVLGAVTSYTLTGLPVGRLAAVAVSAITAAGEGVPGPGRTVTLIADGTPTTLARFSPTTSVLTGNLPPTETANGVAVSDLTRAANLENSNVSSYATGLCVLATGNVWESTYSAAVAAGRKVTLAVQPAAGRAMTLGTLGVAAAVQTAAGQIGLRYQVGSGSWTDLGPLPTTATYQRGGTFDLSAVVAVTGVVTFEFYPYAMTTYDTAVVRAVTLTGSTAPAAATWPTHATFDADTPGAVPAGWTAAGAGPLPVRTGSPAGGNGVGLAGGSAADDSVILYTAGGAHADVAVQVQTVWGVTGGGELAASITPVGRVAADYSAASLAFLTNVNLVVYEKYAAGGYTALIATAAHGLTLAAGDRLWVRAEWQGTTVRAKIWRQGAAEPGSWLVSGTTGVSGAGYVGLRAGNSSAAYPLMADEFFADAAGASFVYPS